MCLRCCGRDHFGKCVEEARCFVCAGKHEEASTNVLSKAAVSARSHANTTRRSARTAKDHTKRDRKSALEGDLADRLV
jgi:hypothetical protein